MPVTIATASTDFVSRLVISEADWTTVTVSEVIESMFAILLASVESLKSDMPEALTVTFEPALSASCEHLSRNEPRLLVLSERFTVPRMPSAAIAPRAPATALSWSLPTVWTMPVAFTIAPEALPRSEVMSAADTALVSVRLVIESMASMFSTILVK